MFPNRFFSRVSYFYWPTNYWQIVAIGIIDAGEMFEFGTVCDIFILEDRPSFTLIEAIKTFSLKDKLSFDLREKIKSFILRG